MSLSTLTAFDFIPDPSFATPGLFNRIFSTISDNIGTMNSVAVPPAVLSSSTYASINLVANSSIGSDYIRLVDSSGQRSTYRIGSFAGGTADGLNIYDESGSTMLVSFSKQSIRFFQNLVGPVFDTGGAFTSTLNAATFGIASDSTESRIQAAISAASLAGAARVYLPASFVPYSGSSISFNKNVQMVREGGDQNVYDLKAYGARGNGIADDTNPILSAATAAAGKTLYFPSVTSRYVVTDQILLTNKLRAIGEGWPEIHQSGQHLPIFVVANDNEIAYITFSGESSTNASYFGRGIIYIDPNADNSIGKRLWIHHNKFDATVPISCIAGNNWTDVRVEDNHFSLSSTAEHGCYTSSGGSGVWIVRNHIEKADSNALGTLAVDVKGSSHVWIEDNEFVGPGWDNGGIGLNTVGNTSVQIRGNTFSSWSNQVSAIVLGNSSTDTDIIVENNDIDGAFYGVYSKANNVTISRNRIRNCQFRGIEVDGTANAQKTTIRDNDVINCVGGIRVASAGTDTYIWDNVVVGASGVGIEWASGVTIGSVKGNVVRGHATGMTLSGSPPNYDNDVLGVIYDEYGTWTPTLGGNTTYTVQSGEYTKKGRQVTARATITVNVLGTGSTNLVSGLPYTISATNSGSVSYFASLAINVVFIAPYGVDASKTMQFASLAAAGGTATAASAIFGNGTHINFCMTYLTT